MRTHGRTVAVLAVVLGLSLGACNGEPADPEPTPGVDFAAVRSAREAFAAPAQDLGTAVRAVVAAGRAARFEAPPSTADGRPAVAERAFLIDTFEQLLDDVGTSAQEVDLEAAVAADPNVSVAVEAWASARRGVTAMVAAGRLEAELLRELLDAEAALAGLAALWDEPGSRAEQTQRLTEAGTEAEDIVTLLSVVDEVPPCSAAVQRRRDAASRVAERTFELAGYVRNGQGTAFDEARASYDLEPWHDGLPVADVADESCWEAASPVATTGADVEAAILSLVEALNPEVGLPSSAEDGS